MSAEAGDLLQLGAAAAAAGGAAALAFAALALATRLGRAAAALRSKEGTGAFRPAPIVLLAAANARWVPAAPLEALDRWIRRAGRPLELCAPELVALVEVAAAVSLAAGAGVMLWAGASAAAPLVCTLAGAASPLIWVRDRLCARRREIIRALPYCVDLLTLSVEAGLDFTAALGKVVERGRRGPLRDELSIAIKELRLGRTRDEALHDLARRVSLPALSSFVQALIQADRMGTPLARVLRVIATQMRVERTHRAEKLANEAPVKLLLPLVLCIFPTLFLMLFGPIAYQVLSGGSF